MWYVAAQDIFEAVLLTTLLTVAHFLSPQAAALALCCHLLMPPVSVQLVPILSVSDGWPESRTWVDRYQRTSLETKSWEWVGGTNTEPFARDRQPVVTEASSPSYEDLVLLVCFDIQGASVWQRPLMAYIFFMGLLFSDKYFDIPNKPVALSILYLGPHTLKIDFRNG